MQSSEKTAELTKALIEVQKELKPVKRSMTNTFFHSKYATLDDVLAACVPILNKNGLAILQPIETLENGDTVLETRIIHTSGEWISSKAKIQSFQQKGANSLQEFGISITYMRRYMVTAALGMSTEDDNDGNSGEKPAKKEKKPFNVNNPSTWPFGAKDWTVMIDLAVEHLDNVPDAETSKKAIKDQFGGKGSAITAFEYLRDEYGKDENE